MSTFIISYEKLFKEITIDGVKSHIDNEIKELDEKRQELLDRINYLKNTRDIGLTFEEIKLQLGRASREREMCKKRKSELRKKFRDGKITIPKILISEITYTYEKKGHVLKILPDDYSPDIDFEQKIFKFKTYKDNDDNLSVNERLENRIKFYNNQLTDSQEIDRYNTYHPKYLKVKHLYENFFKMRNGETADEFYSRTNQFEYIKCMDLQSLTLLTETGEYTISCNTRNNMISVRINDTELIKIFDPKLK